MDIDALRAQKPGCAGRIHLNNAGAALLAEPTLIAMTAQLRREAEIGGYEAGAEAAEACHKPSFTGAASEYVGLLACQGSGCHRAVLGDEPELAGAGGGLGAVGCAEL